MAAGWLCRPFPKPRVQGAACREQLGIGGGETSTELTPKGWLPTEAPTPEAQSMGAIPGTEHGGPAIARQGCGPRHPRPPPPVPTQPAQPASRFPPRPASRPPATKGGLIDGRTQQGLGKLRSLPLSASSGSAGRAFDHPPSHQWGPAGGRTQPRRQDKQHAAPEHRTGE